MKNFKLLFLPIAILFFIASNIYSQQTNNGNIQNAFRQMISPVLSNTTFLLDSAIVIKGDGTKERHIYTYTDASNNQWATYLWQNWDGNNWNNYSYFTYNYTQSGYFENGLGKMWNGSSWDNYFRYTITWDGNHQTGTLTEMWNANSWTTIDSTIVQYDLTNNTFTTIDVMNFGNYVTTTKVTTTIDANDNNESELKQTWNGSSWINTEFTTHTFDSNHNRTSDLIKKWSSTQWEDSLKYTFVYDSNKESRVSELFQSWIGTSWHNDQKNTITFDSRNYMTNLLLSTWDGSAWNDYRRFSYNYSADGNFFHGKSEAWTGQWAISEGEFHFFDTKGYYTDGTSYLLDGTEMDAYFANVTGMGENYETISEYSLSQNYPNPFNPSTIIKYSIPVLNTGITQVQLRIYNVLGQEVKELVNKEQPSGNYQVTFSADNLPSGIYFYRITAGSFSNVKKMILLR